MDILMIVLSCIFGIVCNGISIIILAAILDIDPNYVQWPIRVMVGVIFFLPWVATVLILSFLFAFGITMTVFTIIKWIITGEI